MHRSKTADALLDHLAMEHNIEIAIISEQYLKPRNGFWLEDDTKTAAIRLPQNKNNPINVTGAGNGFTCIQMKNIKIVNCYLTPSDNFENFIEKLNNMKTNSRTAPKHS